MKTMKYLALILLLIAPSICSAGIKFGTLPSIPAASTAPAEASPTPQSEITRVLGLLPRPQVRFVDFGCGPEARWCIAAALKWNCPVTGIEIDPGRAAAARQRVKNEGLDRFITIIEGDAVTTAVQADVGVAYLYQETLDKLKPQIEKLQAFASYIHKPPVAATLSGDTWIYSRPAQMMARGAVWGGQVYSGPVCNNPNCGMCNSIRSQLAAQTVQQTSGFQDAPRGHYEKRKFCNGRSCWFADVWVQDN